MTKIGIDPGNQGAIALLDHDGSLIEVVDMPLMPLSKTKKQVNAAELANIIEEFGASLSQKKTTVYLEKVNSMPGQGVASMFNFGKGVGVVEGVVAALRLPIKHVTPNTWKKRAGLIGADKDMARTKAIQLYPEASLARKKDIGRADAILIARYGGNSESEDL